MDQSLEVKAQVEVQNGVEEDAQIVGQGDQITIETKFSMLFADTLVLNALEVGGPSSLRPLITPNPLILRS